MDCFEEVILRTVDGLTILNLLSELGWIPELELVDLVVLGRIVDEPVVRFA